MDRIRQALDRARRERGDGVAASPSGTALRQSDAPAHGAGARWTATGVAAAVPAATADAAAAEPRARPFDVSPAVLERNRIVIDNDHAPASRVFGILRTQVLQRMRERGWQTVGIAGARRGAGKTTVAANLASAIARSPRQTALLVDLDLRRPAVASSFGLAPDRGVEDVLGGAHTVPECLYRPRSFDDLVLLPARAPVSAPSEIVAAARCQSLIAELRGRYPDRIVLFDLPPVLEADDVAAIAPHLDCLLLVVAEYQTSRDDVSRALQLLVRTPVVGTVLNRSLEKMTSEAYR